MRFLQHCARPHDDAVEVLAAEHDRRHLDHLLIAGATDEEPAKVLVLTDMFGGTPANLAVTFVSERVEVITGVNLPMLIKLARPQKFADLASLARDMREHGRNAIWVASDLLKGEKA